MKKGIIFSLLSLSLFLAVAFAQDAETQSEVDIMMEAYIVTTETDADGNVTEVFEVASEAQPGDLIEYRVMLENVSDSELAAGDVSASGPVPPNTVFVADSASEAAPYQTDFSADGGETYSQMPMITVTNDEGEEEEIVAAPEEYTTVRWTLLESLSPQDSHAFSYRVTVR